VGAALSRRAAPDSNRLVVETDNAVLDAANVIVATGPFQEPMEAHAVRAAVVRIVARAAGTDRLS
jgi:hypothetical protein